VIWCVLFLCRNTVDPQGVLTLNLTDQLEQGVRRPFKKLYKHVTNRLPLEPARRCPDLASPAHDGRLSYLGPSGCPGGAQIGQTSREKRAGEGCRTRSNMPRPPGGERVMSQSVRLSSCIHRSVTYCRPPGGGGTDLRGQQWFGIPCSDECIPLSGQRPFTISSQKWRTLILLLCPILLTFVTFPHSSKMAAETPSDAQLHGWSSNT